MSNVIVYPGRQWGEEPPSERTILKPSLTAQCYNRIRPHGQICEMPAYVNHHANNSSSLFHYQHEQASCLGLFRFRIVKAPPSYFSLQTNSSIASLLSIARKTCSWKSTLPLTLGMQDPLFAVPCFLFSQRLELAIPCTHTQRISMAHMNAVQIVCAVRYSDKEGSTVHYYSISDIYLL